MNIKYIKSEFKLRKPTNPNVDLEVIECKKEVFEPYFGGPIPEGATLYKENCGGVGYEPKPEIEYSKYLMY